MKAPQQAWAGLAWPVLSAIIEKITVIDDYVRFGAICTPWRTAALLEETSVTVKKKQQLSSFPFLLIPRPEPQLLLEPEPLPQKVTLKRKAFSLAQCIRVKRRKEPEEEAPTAEEAAGRCLYSIARKKVYDFQVQLHHREYCRGSSFGWLVTMKKQEYWTGKNITAVKYHIRIQNPFLPEKYNINLPPLPLYGVVEQDGANDDLSRPFIYVRKAVLSAPPDNNHNKNFTVMAIVSQFCRLAYFNPAREDSFGWTPIGDWNNWKNFGDVVYFNKAKQFYAIRRETGGVYAIDIREDTKGSVLSELRQVAPPLPNPEKGFLLTRFIVESPSGDLLQVLKKTPSGECTLDVKFEVFKLDAIGEGLGWIQMHSLGNTTLFLGQNASVARTVSESPEWKLNCIYFTDNSHYWFSPEWKVYYPRDMGIYNLEDGTIQPFFSTMSQAPQAMSPVWLEPPLLKTNLGKS